MPNTDTMAFVFFVYGLSFFTLGLAITVYPKRHSVFALAPDLNLIAAFGFTHGINEWLDLFILINTSGSTHTLEVIRSITLPVSFLFLVIFGIKAMTQGHPRHRCWMIAVPVMQISVWALIVILSKDRLLMGDIGARYGIGLPGAFLAAHGLHLHLRQLRKTKLAPVLKNLRFMIGVFLIYGLLAGAVVKSAPFPPASFLNYEGFMHFVGMPIQVFRGIAAVLLAYATLRVLQVFRWETQNRLEEEELWIHTIAAAVPVVLFQYDKRGVLRHIEGRNLDNLSPDPRSLIGQPITALFPSLDIAEIEGNPWGVGEVYSNPVTAGDKTYYLCCAPTHSGDGSISGFVGAALDITRQLAHQNEIETYRRELSQTRQLTELGTMSTLVARRLWQPLQVVTLQIQRLLLDKESLDNPQRVTRVLEESMKEIENATSQAQRLRDRAQVTAMESSKTIALNRLFQRLATVYCDRARSTHTEFVVQVPEAIPLLAIAERELEYMATALIECVLDHGSGETPSQFIIKADVGDQAVTLSFTDTHRTLSSEEQDGMFVPFPETLANTQGCGLSMAVVNEIVQTHGGTIGIDSQAGQGTTFRMSLPLKPKA